MSKAESIWGVVFTDAGLEELGDEIKPHLAEGENTRYMFCKHVDMRPPVHLGEKISKAESGRRLAQGNAYIFTFNDRYDIDGKILRNTARYINHSCAPNCEVEQTTRTLWIVALRHIRDGEELTYNYGYEFDPDSYHDFPCHCGAAQCCGYILAEQYWGLLPQSTKVSRA